MSFLKYYLPYHLVLERVIFMYNGCNQLQQEEEEKKEVEEEENSNGELLFLLSLHMFYTNE